MTQNGVSPSDRRAIEALRAGVPNGDAVRALASSQPHIVELFDRKLATPEDLRGDEPTGFVIAGRFGTGKSHVVEELHQRALAQGFISSKVSISKETPLHLPARVVAAAVNAMQAQDKPDGVLLDVIMKLQSEAPEVLEFERWCGTRSSKISVIFRSLLQLRSRRAHDVGCIDLLLRYFSGETVPIGAIKAQLREAGLDGPLEVVLAADRPWQTMRFLTRLCQASGYRGWVIFLDEVELIAKYGRLSRARAYDQLGRWLGLMSGHRLVGTTVVATVIEDFVQGVIPSDRWLVPEVLEHGRRLADQHGVPFATKAIAAIDAAHRLKGVSLPHLQGAHDTLREAHSRAYSWQAPELEVDFHPDGRMRLYVRRWINQWDLSRLYGDRPLTFGEESIDIGLTEDRDYDPQHEG